MTDKEIADKIGVELLKISNILRGQDDILWVTWNHHSVGFVDATRQMEFHIKLEARPLDEDEIFDVEEEMQRR